MTIIDEGIELPSLVAASVSFVTDTTLEDVVEQEYERVTVANPTHDPNRYTVHVPSESTVLSLGAASPRWNTDIGITGYTDAHVHFETKAHDKTIVSLGESAKTSAIVGFAGKPPVKTAGYAMVTAELAWHEATLQHYLLSQEGDISMSTMGADSRAVVQADTGKVDVNGKNVNISGGSVSIGAAAALPMQDTKYAEAWKPVTVSTTSADNAKLGMDCVSAVFAAHDLVLAAVKTVKAGKAGELHMNDYTFSDIANWGFCAAQFYLSAKSLRDTFAHAASPPGCVKISAQKDLVGVGGSSVAFFGSRSASLATTGCANVGAGLMATLKGTVFAGTSAILSSLKALKKVEVASNWGDVVLGAKKNVNLVSADELVMGGDEVVQVTGGESLLVGGAKRAWLGSSGGGGFGLAFIHSGVSFGKAKSTDKMKVAKNEPSPAVRVDTGKIEIRGTDGAITLSNDLCLLEAPKIRLDAKQKNVTVNGSLIKLD
jgi:hypothetical protein